MERKAGDLSSVESLSIPRRQKVFEKTYLPLGDTLPVWGATPLDAKICVPPSPRGSYTLYTNRIGEPKYISQQRYDFDLTNPNGRQAPGPYDSLCDPSLRSYFLSPKTRRHLKHNGLITDHGEVICDIKEFNQYREFVRYRSVTELALQRKKEQRLKEERRNQYLLDWPNNFKSQKLKKQRRLRQTKSEQPPSKLPELNRYGMYQAPGRSQSFRSNTDTKSQTSEGMKQSRTSGENNSDTEQSISFRIPLIEEIKRRDTERQKKLEKKKKEREEERLRKLKEDWKERQSRQEEMLRQEAEIEAKYNKLRAQRTQERDQTKGKQNQKQENKVNGLRDANRRHFSTTESRDNDSEQEKSRENKKKDTENNEPGRKGDENEND